MSWILGSALAAEPPEATVGAYVESFWSWNFARPENGVTNLRGFDNRHATISLSNVAVDVAGGAGPVAARVVLQAGLTPNTYTLAEPAYPVVGGVGETDRVTWRNVQQAWGAWSATDTLTVDAGLFLSPIGPESIAVKDNWNFSRSNLFYGLPFYHTGARVAWRPTEAVALEGMVCNGWNSVVDNNTGKSPSLRLSLATGRLTGAVLYFGGPERSAGAPEGQPWRHLGDLWAQLDATDRLSFLAQADGGYEAHFLGSNAWLAGALSARVEFLDGVYVSARGDWFREARTGTASPIFWPLGDDDVGRVASGTLTLDWTPIEGLSLRLEGRHDAADDPVFFDDDVRVVGGAQVADDRTQDTVTTALVAWF